MHYNTTKLDLGELHKESLIAESQEIFIKEVFKAKPQNWFTPFDIQVIAESNGKQMEITSIRRAITDMTNEGILVKSAKANLVGKFGKKNHSWKFNNGELL